MSKEVVMNMWCSQIPETMYNDWVTRKLIRKGAWDLGCTQNTEVIGKYVDIMGKDGPEAGRWLSARNKEEVVKLRAKGYRVIYHRFYVSEDTMDILQKESGEWYAEVFLYVENWLKKNDFISLKSGSFRGGFCAVEKEDRTTVSYGAPLAHKKNKVGQIKEKFGRITVYFNALTPKERQRINRFESHVSKKFDCQTCFV